VDISKSAFTTIGFTVEDAQFIKAIHLR